VWLSGNALVSNILHNTKTYTTKPNKTKLALVQVAFYAIRPENGLGLFYNNSARDPHGPIIGNKIHSTYSLSCRYGLLDWTSRPHHFPFSFFSSTFFVWFHAADQAGYSSLFGCTLSLSCHIVSYKPFHVWRPRGSRCRTRDDIDNTWSAYIHP